MNQAGRTRDLVADLLSFAQQSPVEKIPVDVTILLQRACQMLESRRVSETSAVGLSIGADSPQVQGNANRLFQAFVEIIENAMDALEESGGGSLEITAQRQGKEAVLQFSDIWAGDSRTAAGFRSVLYHQAGRKRYGARVERGVWRDSGSQRPDHLPEQARRRGAVRSATPR